MIMLTPSFKTRPVPSRSGIFDDFDQLVDSLLWFDPATKSQFNPVCDVNESESHFLVSLDMPGVREDDLKIEVLENKLTVSGERHSEVTDADGRHHHSERSYGSFQRCFSLPDSVDIERIEANFENGVLAIAIPKKEVAKGRTIQVQSGKNGIFGKLLGGKKEAKIMKDVKAS